MNIEELKLVLETLQHTTDGAKDFGIWWIAMHYGVKLFEALTWVFVIWGIAWGIVKAVSMASGNGDSERRLQNLRDMLRVGSPGIVTSNEYDQMRDKIREFIRGNQQ